MRVVYLSDWEEELPARSPGAHLAGGHPHPQPHPARPHPQPARPARRARTVDLTAEWGAHVNQRRGHCAKMRAILVQRVASTSGGSVRPAQGRAG